MDMKQYTWDMVHVDREQFLRKSLLAYVSSEQVEKSLQSKQPTACLTKEQRKQLADACIRKRCLYVGGLSAVTSLHGALGTVLLMPVDCAQFAYHTLKLAQELYYIYGTKQMFSFKSKEELEVLLYMMVGADCAISIAGSTLSALGQKLYQTAMRKLTLQGASILPYVGCAIHCSMSIYALYSLADEYVQRLQDMCTSQSETTTADIVKEIGEIVEAEYREVEEKLHSFCDLKKLKEFYTYVEEGYISEEELEKMKAAL